MIHTILRDKSTKLFIFLGGFFIVNALTAEMIGVKIFSLEDTLGWQRANITIFGSPFSFHLTAGVLLWPVVFVMTDIINEYYGPRGVKFLSYLTVGLISFAFLVINTAIRLSPSEYFSVGNGIDHPDNAFRGIFGQGLWIILGSMVAFLVGQVLDVLVFHRIKKVTGDKRIWLRATVSTMVSQLVDSYIVLFIAFYVGKRIQAGQGEPWTMHQILVTGTGNYIYKIAVAILLVPLIYAVHALIEKYLGSKLSAELRRAAMGKENE